MALEQLDSEHVLEIFQQLRGARLRHAQNLRSAVNIALIGERYEQ
jgi:hypothetical protein